MREDLKQLAAHFAATRRRCSNLLDWNRHRFEEAEGRLARLDEARRRASLIAAFTFEQPRQRST